MTAFCAVRRVLIWVPARTSQHFHVYTRHIHALGTQWKRSCCLEICSTCTSRSISPSKSSTTISDRFRVRGLREKGVLIVKRGEASERKRARFYLSFPFLRALMLGLPIARAQPSSRLDDSEGRARNQTRAITDPSTPWPFSSSKFLPRLQHSPTFQQKVR